MEPDPGPTHQNDDTDNQEEAMKISRTIVPTLALASLTLAGCSTVESGGSSSSGAAVPSNPMSSSPTAA